MLCVPDSKILGVRIVIVFIPRQDTQPPFVLLLQGGCEDQWTGR